MNAANVLRLKDWVDDNRSWIQSEENPSLGDIRGRAEAELGCTCAKANITDTFEYLGLPTRRTKADAKIRAKDQRIDEYRNMLIRVVSVSMEYLPESLRKELRDEFNIQQEVLNAMSSHPRIVSNGDDDEPMMPSQKKVS